MFSGGIGLIYKMEWVGKKLNLIGRDKKSDED